MIRYLGHRRPFYELWPHSLMVKRLKAQLSKCVLPYICLPDSWKEFVIYLLGTAYLFAQNVRELASMGRGFRNLRQQHMWGDVSGQEYRYQKSHIVTRTSVLKTKLNASQSRMNLVKAAQMLTKGPDLSPHPNIGYVQRERLIGELFSQVQIKGSNLTAATPKVGYKPLIAQ